MMKYVNRGYAFFVFLICLYKQGHLCLHNIIQNIKFRSSSYYDKLNVNVILLKKYINLIKYVNSCCALCSLYAYISKVTTAYIFDSEYKMSLLESLLHSKCNFMMLSKYIDAKKYVNSGCALYSFYAYTSKVIVVNILFFRI